MYELADAFSNYSESRGTTPSRLSVAWTMSRPGVTSAIIGPRTLEQFEDNLKAMDVDVTAEDETVLDEMFPPAAFISKFYEADFGPRSTP